MAESSETGRLKESLTFVFDDPQWVQKLLVGAGLIFLWFIPFLPYIVLMGYMARIMKEMVINDRSPFLPEWSDFNQLFKDGVKLLAVYLLYSLPIMLLVGIGYSAFLFPVLTAEIASVGGRLETMMIILGYLVGFGLMGIGFLFGVAGGVFIPVVLCRVAVEGEIRAAFEFRESWNVLRANWSGFLLAYLVVIGASMIAYYGTQILILTIILCCLYPFVISLVGAYISVVSSALIADAYRDGLHNSVDVVQS